MTERVELPKLRRKVMPRGDLFGVEARARADVVLSRGALRPVADEVERHLEADQSALLVLVRAARVLESVSRDFARVPAGRVVKVVCSGGCERGHALMSG